MHYNRSCAGSGMIAYTKLEGSRVRTRIPEVLKIGIHGSNYASSASESTETGVGK